MFEGKLNICKYWVGKIKTDAHGLRERQKKQ